MSLLNVLLGVPDSKKVSERSSPASPTSPPIAEHRLTAASARLDGARSLIRTCREYGVGLRLETDGTVVVESNGKAWKALVRELERNVDQVAELIAVGWDGTDT